MKLKFFVLIFITVVLGTTSSFSAPIIIGGITYTATGSPETLTATFTQPDGGVTSGQNPTDGTVRSRGLVRVSAMSRGYQMLDSHH